MIGDVTATDDNWLFLFITYIIISFLWFYQHVTPMGWDLVVGGGGKEF